MSTEAKTLPFLRMLARHPRTPVNAFAEAGEVAGGRLVRLNMGPFRPFLATHPDHVKHVLRVNQRNYVRGGMFWDPLAPLLGNGILSDGESWAESRGILHPMFTAKYVNTLTERMAEIINELIDTTLTPGRPVDVAQAISDLVHPTIVRLLLGAKLPQSDVDRLAPAYDTGVTARSIRLLLPFVPERFPLPGDRAFARAIRTIDGIVYPRIRQVRSEIQLDDDVVSALVRARHGIEGAEGDRRIRDDLVAIHGAATETSATALTWVWPVLDAHPEVAAKVYDEIEHVVGNDPVGTAHLTDLRYLRMVVSELLRLYPPGWILPRRAVADDTVDGVTVRAGSTVVLSPFITHRLPQFWERPLEFDPERFAPGGDAERHRYAYFPFSAGPHVCLGPNLFMQEALLLIAAILRRYRPVLEPGSGHLKPRLASTLRPSTGIRMTLLPAGSR